MFKLTSFFKKLAGFRDRASVLGLSRYFENEQLSAHYLRLRTR